MITNRVFSYCIVWSCAIRKWALRIDYSGRGWKVTLKSVLWESHLTKLPVGEVGWVCVNAVAICWGRSWLSKCCPHGARPQAYPCTLFAVGYKFAAFSKKVPWPGLLTCKAAQFLPKSHGPIMSSLRDFWAKRSDANMLMLLGCLHLNMIWVYPKASCVWNLVLIVRH
jgi:hypothetical protein